MRTETKVDSSVVWEVARRIVTMSGTLANHNPLLLSDKVKKVMKVCGNEVEHMLALENTACRSLDERMNFACSQVLRKKEYKSLWRQWIWWRFTLLHVGFHMNQERRRIASTFSEIDDWVMQLLRMTENDYYGLERRQIAKCSKTLQLWAGTKWIWKLDRR